MLLTQQYSDKLKLVCFALAASVILTAVSGQVWNISHWNFHWRQNFNSQLISRDFRTQTIFESCLVMIIYTIISSFFALAIEGIKLSSKYKTKSPVLFVTQVMTITFVILNAIARLKSPTYLNL